MPSKTLLSDSTQCGNTGAYPAIGLETLKFLNGSSAQRHYKPQALTPLEIQSPTTSLSSESFSTSSPRVQVSTMASSRPRRPSVHFAESPTYVLLSPSSTPSSISSVLELDEPASSSTSSVMASSQSTITADDYMSPVPTSPTTSSHSGTSMSIYSPPPSTVPTSVQNSPTSASDASAEQALDALRIASIMWMARSPRYVLLYDVYDPPKANEPGGAHLSNPQATNTPVRVADEQFELHVTSPASPVIHLVCKLFPWIITVRNPDGVTCGNVMNAVFRYLDKPISEEERWVMAGWKKPRNGEYVYSREVSQSWRKRVDVLKDFPVFRGLEMNPSLAAARIGGRSDIDVGLCLAMVFKGPGRER